MLQFYDFFQPSIHLKLENFGDIPFHNPQK